MAEKALAAPCRLVKRDRRPGQRLAATIQGSAGLHQDCWWSTGWLRRNRHCHKDQRSTTDLAGSHERPAQGPRRRQPDWGPRVGTGWLP